MKGTTRRHFLQKSALAGLGIAAVSSGIALGDTEAETILRAVDAELARVLRSYGRTRTMAEAGTQKVVVGSRTCHVPAYHVVVEVRSTEAFCQSFDTLSRFSEPVMVKGNTLKIARGGRYFVIENQTSHHS